MRSFTDKVAAVTGASSGIGRELAVELAARGCHLALCDVNETGLLETIEQARSAGVRVTSRRVDVADRDAMYGWAAQVQKDHGKVNLVFNNAGVGLGSTIEGMSYEDFERLMNVNFWGVVYGTKAFLPHLKATGDGHIVNVSSVLGLAGLPSQAAYNSAKFAVRGFTECLRQELDMLGCGVSATSVHPGGIKTGIARATRLDANMRKLGFNIEGGIEKIERKFNTGADRAARVILTAVEKNKRRALVGRGAYVYDSLVRLLPSAYQRLTVPAARRLLR